MKQRLLTSLLIFILGGLSAFGFAPFYLQWLSGICFIGFFYFLFNATSYKQAFTSGYLFGAGHFIVGLYWIANALMVDAYMLRMFGWLIPFVYLGSGLVMGLFFALPARFSFYGGTRLNRILLFISSFAVFEWVRGWIFTGLPWNKMGAIWVDTLPVLQSISIIGTLGLSFLTLLLFSIFYLIFARFTALRIHLSYMEKIFIGLILTIWVGLTSFGFSHLQPTTYRDTTLKIVQTGLSQKMKWKRSELRNNFEFHRKLSLVPKATDIVIWAESAVAFDLLHNSMLRDEAVDVLQTDDSYLITGFISRSEDNPQNMLGVFNRQGVVATYAKSHLVPFGEYVPLRGILPIKKITEGLTDFKEGEGAITLLPDTDLSFAPAICYEAIFAGSFIDRAHRPNWILILTNDAWYGNSMGPYQHLAEAQLRAVEEGLPVVRSAYSGVSTVIDPYGRILKLIPLGVVGVIDSALPTALPATLFSYFYPWAHLLIFSLIIGWICWRRRYDHT